jgi:hypothetical protein
MNRSEHLAWAKNRALAYVDRGDLANAFASMQSDLSKHRELEDHLSLDLGMQLILMGHLNSAKDMRDFIEGCN